MVARRPDGGSRILSLKSAVAEGDLVITADNSYARIKWGDGGEVVLRPNTPLKIAAYTYDERGFAWLTRNLAWAKAHGIRLLLNLHVPQGGFQSAGEGRALWNDPENQRRFVALWREIARRYRDHTPLKAIADAARSTEGSIKVLLWRARR